MDVAYDGKVIVKDQWMITDSGTTVMFGLVPLSFSGRTVTLLNQIDLLKQYKPFSMLQVFNQFFIPAPRLVHLQHSMDIFPALTHPLLDSASHLPVMLRLLAVTRRVLLVIPVRFSMFCRVSWFRIVRETFVPQVFTVLMNGHFGWLDKVCVASFTLGHGDLRVTCCFTTIFKRVKWTMLTIS